MGGFGRGAIRTLLAALLIAASTCAAEVPAPRAVLTRVFKGHTGKITAVAIAPDGAIASASADKSIRIWDRLRGDGRLTLQHTAMVYSMAFSPDGQLLATGDGAKTVVLWDTRTGQKKSTLGPIGGAVMPVGFSADGKTLAASGGAGGKVWDVATGQEKMSFEGKFALSPDGLTLATAGGDGRIQLHDVATGKRTREMAGHEGRVGCLAFSPDGKTLATGGADAQGIRSTGNEPGQDKLIRIWDVATGKQRFELAEHKKGLYSLSFAADGQSLVAADYNGSMKHWDVAGGKLLATLGGVDAGGTLRGTPIGPWTISKDLQTWVAGTEMEVQILRISDFTRR